MMKDDSAPFTGRYSGQHAVYLLCETKENVVRDGIAEGFPLHFTLRGRFVPFSLATAEARVAEALADLRPRMIEVERTLTAGMTWAVPRAAADRDWIARMHELVSSRLGPLVRADAVPAAHQGAGYRPHLTLSFGDTGPAVAPPRFNIETREWALVEYTGNPGRPVRTVARG